jgi:5-methylcytosine-specific restriction endonuclease McrA
MNAKTHSNDYNRRYRMFHPEIMQASDRRRWARIKSDPARYQAERRRQRTGKLMREYGLTDQEFLLLLGMQGDSCAICHKPLVPGTSDTHIDHDHAYARGDVRGVRGVLCQKCNRAVGLMNDDAVRAASMSLYLTT